jgi:UDP-N-acetylmuramate--alanine ligase
MTIESLPKHIHLIGIGGAGLSAIALVLLESGYTVSGSDRTLSDLARRLQTAGAHVYTGHQAQNIAGASLVIRSSAVPDDNVEVRAAQAAGIPVIKRSDFLGKLMDGHQGIAVAGTHGKTTTTAMIAWVLTALNKDPSYIIGGVSLNLGTNAHAGAGPSFVIEADEYDRMFLGLRPQIAVVLNVEHDHPDCYPTPEDFHQAFRDFTGCITPEGVLFACSDESGARQLIASARQQKVRTYTYGLLSQSGGPAPDVCATNLHLNQQGNFTFDVLVNPQLKDRSHVREGNQLKPYPGDPFGPIALQVPGQHNVLNALATLSVACWLDLPLAEAGRALAGYKGTGRRFDVRGVAGGVIVIDDYAHHPTEIRATLSAARARYGDRPLWVVWQPHTYSRTRALASDFATAFREADHVIVTQVFAARESFPEDGFNAQAVVSAIQHPDARYVAELEQATAILVGGLHHGDVLLVLSAGDADRVSREVFAGLQDRAG